MIERPIDLKQHEVIAILEGRKNQLRRIVSNQPSPRRKWVGLLQDGKRLLATWAQSKGDMLSSAVQIKSPFGMVGDRLWVREVFNLIYGQRHPNQVIEIEYKADNQPSMMGVSGTHHWRKGRDMPRSASRIILEITAIKVEQTDEGWFWVVDFKRIGNNGGKARSKIIKIEKIMDT